MPDAEDLEKLAIKRAARKRKKAKKAPWKQIPMDQDERFFFIVGCTSGGASYGVTWGR